MATTKIHFYRFRNKNFVINILHVTLFAHTKTQHNANKQLSLITSIRESRDGNNCHNLNVPLNGK